VEEIAIMAHYEDLPTQRLAVFRFGPEGLNIALMRHQQLRKGALGKSADLRLIFTKGEGAFHVVDDEADKLLSLSRQARWARFSKLFKDAVFDEDEAQADETVSFREVRF
jgi:hypothetical protein